MNGRRQLKSQSSWLSFINNCVFSVHLWRKIVYFYASPLTLSGRIQWLWLWFPLCLKPCFHLKISLEIFNTNMLNLNCSKYNLVIQMSAWNMIENSNHRSYQNFNNFIVEMHSPSEKPLQLFQKFFSHLLFVLFSVCLLLGHTLFCIHYKKRHTMHRMIKKFIKNIIQWLMGPKGYTCQNALTIVMWWNKLWCDLLDIIQYVT